VYDRPDIDRKAVCVRKASSTFSKALGVVLYDRPDLCHKALWALCLTGLICNIKVLMSLDIIPHCLYTA